MKKKLKLSRQTIARLTDPSLAQVAGGTGEGTDTGDTTPAAGSYIIQTQAWPCNASDGQGCCSHRRC